MTELPYSDSAEQAVLCSMLLHEDLQGDGLGGLESRDFYDSKNAGIFSAVHEMFDQGKKVDVVTLAEYLSATSNLEHCGGIGYISTLVDLGYSRSAFEDHVEIVRNKAIQRRVISAAQKIVSKAKDTPYNEVNDVLDVAERLIYEASASKQTSGPVSVRDLVFPAVERIERRIKEGNPIMGIPIGVSSFDYMTSGLQGGQLSILAARPSMGKTSFCLQVAGHIAVDLQTPVYLWELEMSKEDLTERMISQRGAVDFARMRAGTLHDTELKRIGEASNEIYGSPLFIDDNPSLSVTELRSKARRLANQHGKGIIIVDYLQLMNIPGDNRNEGVGKVSRAAKLLARELDMPVLMLSQLSRGPENREDKRPRLADLRDSGSIEQDADNVFFLYRPEIYYGKVAKDGTNIEGDAEIIVGKQRNGPIGFVKSKFDKRVMLFHEQ